MNKEDISNLIKEYLKENLKVHVLCKNDNANHAEIEVGIKLGEETIDTSTDWIYVG